MHTCEELKDMIDCPTYNVSEINCDIGDIVKLSFGNNYGIPKIFKNKSHEYIVVDKIGGDQIALTPVDDSLPNIRILKTGYLNKKMKQRDCWDDDFEKYINYKSNFRNWKNLVVSIDKVGEDSTITSKQLKSKYDKLLSDMNDIIVGRYIDEYCIYKLYESYKWLYNKYDLDNKIIIKTKFKEFLIERVSNHEQYMIDAFKNLSNGLVLYTTQTFRNMFGCNTHIYKVMLSEVDSSYKYDINTVCKDINVRYRSNTSRKLNNVSFKFNYNNIIISSDDYVDVKINVTDFEKHHITFYEAGCESKLEYKKVYEDTGVKHKVYSSEEILSFVNKYGKYVNLNWLDTSNVTSMYRLFDKSDFNGDISQWDTSNVTDMRSMFCQTPFNGDISQWDTSKVTDMSYMFSWNEKFDGNISQWDTSKVTDMSYMFIYTKRFYKGISNWDTSNVTDMYGMFDACKFNGDISNWDVSKVTDMGSMFYDTKFTRNINRWDVASVTNTKHMFGCHKDIRNIPHWYNGG